MKILTSLLILFCGSILKAKETNSFRVQLVSEAQSLNPSHYYSSNSSVLFYNLYRSLYFLNIDGKITPTGKNNCSFNTKLKIICKLDKSFKFSDGSKIKAKHYKNAFLNIYSKNSKSYFTQSYISIKNATKIIKGSADLATLGVSAVGDYKLVFSFDNWDPEFLYKLALPVSAPLINLNFPKTKNANILIASGPYQIKKWSVNNKITLISNANFYIKNNRPPVELVLIESDATALSMFEAGRLDYLRRLPFRYINSYKNKKEFKFDATTRFDYIGFSKKVRDNKALSNALTKTLKYTELQKIFNSPAIPGCVGLPEFLISNYHCFKFNSLASLSESAVVTGKKLKLSYSHLGGDSHSQVMQWFQNQWSKHLKVSIELDPQESAMFYSKLRTDKLDIFRKGVNLNRPTCLAALEIFSKGHPENFIKYDNPKFEKLILKLKSYGSSQNSKINKNISKKLCSRAVKLLADDTAIIPLGRMYFASLLNQSFKGVRVNDLFQLDLSSLEIKKSPRL